MGVCHAPGTGSGAQSMNRAVRGPPPAPSRHSASALPLHDCTASPAIRIQQVSGHFFGGLRPASHGPDKSRPRALLERRLSARPEEKFSFIDIGADARAGLRSLANERRADGVCVTTPLCARRAIAIAPCEHAVHDYRRFAAYNRN